MIISPPFLPLRAPGISDVDFVNNAMPYATVNCPGASVPEGSFPVSLKLGWHGGIHIHAPTTGTMTLPVRAIADGDVVFARKSAARTADPANPQNYNPYGKDPAWTDNGMIILRHVTDIGEGASAEAITFYSILTHLSELRGTALKVANGIAAPNQRKVFRKEELGMAGRIYNVPDHLHLEIVCDDINFRKLIGRGTGSLNLSQDGRVDAIYGELYFHLPAGAKFYAAKPQANIKEPSSAPIFTSDTPLMIGLRHANGEGATEHRGDDYFTTYRLDGRVIGEIVEDSRAEYLTYSRAFTMVEEFSSGSRPAPSAVYELLRFGRVINTPDENLSPSDCPHWRCVSYGAGKGWINLNAAGITKYSDADFPQWKSWSIIDDDVDGDSRANSNLLSRIIEDVSNANGVLTRNELERGLNEKGVKDSLRKSICKFPSEWNADTVDERWRWLLTDPEYQLAGDDWKNFKEHVIALGVPSSSLPESMRGAHWHFHPVEFICHLRKCLWLSAGEFKQLVPRQALRKSGSTVLWEPVQSNLSSPTSVMVTQPIMLNKMARKYGITSPLRLACLLGNAVQETQWLGKLSEGGGDTLWYAPWYGRGFLQLTHPANYIDYWRYRGRQVPEALKVALGSAETAIAAQPGPQRSNVTLRDHLFPQLTQQMRGWREEVRGIEMAGSKGASYAPADSAGFYWANLKMASYADGDHVLQRILVQTNQGAKVYYRSPSFWRASAAVNLPGVINNLYARQLNGFDARCVAYGYAMAVLSEMMFPNSAGSPTTEFPEGYLPRRD
jgi:predicted chitinase